MPTAKSSFGVRLSLLISKQHHQNSPQSRSQITLGSGVSTAPWALGQDTGPQRWTLRTHWAMGWLGGLNGSWSVSGLAQSMRQWMSVHHALRNSSGNHRSTSSACQWRMSWRESPEGELREGSCQSRFWGQNGAKRTTNQLGVKRSPWKNQVYKDREKRTPN